MSTRADINIPRLKALRGFHLLTQRDLAQRIARTEGWVKALETGRARATRDDLARLAVALSCEIGYLIGEAVDDG